MFTINYNLFTDIGNPSVDTLIDAKCLVSTKCLPGEENWPFAKSLASAKSLAFAKSLPKLVLLKVNHL